MAKTNKNTINRLTVNQIVNTLLNINKANMSLGKALFYLRIYFQKPQSIY